MTNEDAEFFNTAISDFFNSKGDDGITLEPGWLNRQMNEHMINWATYPEWMRRDGSATDDDLTQEQRQEAARRLRERANELDPQPDINEAYKKIITVLNDAPHSSLCASITQVYPSMPAFAGLICKSFIPRQNCCQRCDWLLATPKITKPCDCWKGKI